MNISKILWLGDVRPTMNYLKTDSEFGKKINFYPNVTVISGLNPVVEELKKSAKIK